MNKLSFAILASVALLAGCVSSQSHMNYSHVDTAHAGAPEKTYVVDSAGAPVRSGDHCVVADGNSGTYLEECDSTKMAAMQHSQPKKMYQPAPAPKPRIITRVIVDCTKCPR